ncbi:MAG: flagellin [Lachnospiraceae bacterium]|nr:flagellin [Lachnospiraceae bacterium]
MVVQHNLTAMNSNRMLGITSKSQAKATEKLSSGYKINRAADDAAGLSISEKMRKQIRGLTQASANAQDGISAVQTAEGALTEVHDMLQRMNELAVKAANGTNSKDDRSYIQAEVDQLVTEIDRVSTTTKFNETYLLKGTNTDANGGVGALSFATAKANLGTKVGGAAIEFDSDGIKTAVTSAVDALAYSTGTAATDTVNATKGIKIQFGASTDVYKLYEGVSDADLKKSASANEVGKTIFTSRDSFINALKEKAGELGISKEIKDISFDKDGKVQITAFADLNKGLDVSLHVGADSTKDNKIGLTVEMMSARGLGVNGIRVDGSDDKNATASIDTIKAAIQKVSEQRSALGAVQNRLDHTINNLDNVVENTTSAESAIRDTDMATQMVAYSNNLDSVDSKATSGHHFDRKSNLVILC